LCRQTIPCEEFEVIIVDDGSTDHTQDAVARLGLPDSFKYVRQVNSGAAAARNRGARLAGRDVLVFLDSDVIADAPLLEEHLNCHRRHQRTLVVGQTRSVPPERPDPFYDVLGPEVFAFDAGKEEKPLDFQEILSRNLSMPRTAFHEIGGFDQEFPRSGFEDIEFAYRASQLGLGMVYNPKASGDHVHFGTLTEVGQHMYGYQMSAALLVKKYPELKGKIRHLRDKEPIRWRQDGPGLIVQKAARRVLVFPVSVWLLTKVTHVLQKWYPWPPLLRFFYWQVLGSYLFLGFRAGIKRYNLTF
jgi:GT2 family glycosyltransferase